MASQLLGGIGLFLLGVFLLADRLKLAAGDALRRILLRFTGRPVTAFAWKGSVLLGVVAGTAMLLNQVLGALAGVAIPFGLKACKVDPALASSIFVTALTDTMGFLVFLGLATLAMRAFGS